MIYDTRERILQVSSPLALLLLPLFMSTPVFILLLCDSSCCIPRHHKEDPQMFPANGKDNEAYQNEEEEDDDFESKQEALSNNDPQKTPENEDDSAQTRRPSETFSKQESLPLIFGAINTGNYEAVKDLLSQTTEFLNSSTYGGITPLIAACHMRQLDILKLLISHGAKVKCFDSMGNTALHVAVTSKWHEGIAELLQQGASPNEMSRPTLGMDSFMRESPLHVAIRLGDMTATTMLLKHQPDLFVKDSKSFSAFHLAASKRNLEILNKLMEENNNMNSINEASSDGFSLFHAAMSRDTPIKSESQVLKIIQKIHTICDNINQVNTKGETPLYIACLHGLPTVVKYLIANGADPTQVTRERQSVIHAACLASCPLILQHLFATGRVGHLITCRDNSGYLPFYFAVEIGSVECCKVLLEKGERLTSLSHNGMTNCQLVIDKLPSAVQLFKELFDAGVKLSKKPQHDPEFSISFDYSVLMSSEKENMQCSIASEFVGTPLESFIKHPLLESFLYLKWCSIRKTFYANVIQFFIYLIMHTVFVMLTYGSNRIDWTQHPGGLQTFKTFHFILLIIIFVPGALVTVANFKNYFLQLETYTRLCALLFSAIVIFVTSSVPRDIAYLNSTLSENGTASNISLSEDIEPFISSDRALASLSVFLGWVQLMLLLGRFPSLGAYILMFAKVAKSLIKFILSFLSLLIGFSLSFHILFFQMPVFADYQLSFVKTLMMMTGEIAYSEFVNEKDMPFSTFSLTILSIFLFMVTVVMSNLLIGLAVNDIPDLKRQGKIKRLVKQASYLMAYEKLILYTSSMTFFPRKLRKFMYENCNIKSQVTVWPNKEITRSKYRQTLPSETIKEAITLGSCENPEDFPTPSEDDGITDQIKAFQIRYHSDRRTQRHKFSDLSNVCSNIQKQIELLQQKMDNQMSHMSMQLQQQLQQNQNMYNYLSQVEPQKKSES